MSLLDRLRAQPKWKHADPAVRITALDELGDDQQELFAAIAREDDDAAVRRAAVARLDLVAVLAEIARSDRDESVRSAAADALAQIARADFEGASESDAAAALDALGDERHAVDVAKRTPLESVARAALARLTDERSFGSVARRALHASVRLDAFARVSSPGELLNVAVRSDYKDTAVAAVERLQDADALEAAASRAKDKAASKRARAILREREEAVRAAEEARREEDAERKKEDAKRKEEDARRKEEDAKRRREDAERKREDAERQAAEEAARRAAAAAATRAAEDAERARAAAEADDARRREATAAARERLEQLVAAVEAAAAPLLADRVEDPRPAHARWQAVREEWTRATESAAPDEGLAQRFSDVVAQVQARDAERRERDARDRRQHLHRLTQLVARAEALAKAQDLTLRAGTRALRDVRDALERLPPLPSPAERDEIARRLKEAQSALAPRVQELRDADEWQRWANASVQEQLCARVEALAAEEDLEKAAKILREVQLEWRKVARAPRAQAESLWHRYKSAADDVRARCAVYFARVAEERGTNLAKKQALAEQAEALAGSTRWIETADRLKQLQAEWKTIGPAPHAQEKAVWERFQRACDRFFTRRHEDLAHRKQEWAKNLAAKTALCVRAETLAESTDWDQAAAELRRLQTEWRAIGPVKKTRADAVWQRFRAACDRFFERYKQRHEIEVTSRVEDRRAICAEMEALAPEIVEEGGAPPPDDLAQRVQTLRQRWMQAPPIPREEATRLTARFEAAVSRLVERHADRFRGTSFDPDANRRRMEQLCERVEKLAPSLSTSDEAISPAERLASMWREALAANTIGGRVDESARRKAAADDVREAQAAWRRIGFVPDVVRRQLTDRFDRACRRVLQPQPPRETRAQQPAAQ